MSRSSTEMSIDTPVRDLPWVQPDEPEERPDPCTCMLCDNDLSADHRPSRGPLCDECRTGFRILTGHGDGSRAEKERGSSRRLGRGLSGGPGDWGAVEREGWAENGVRAMEDGR